MLTTIVVPLDGSDFAAAALSVAIEVGKVTSARLHIVGIARDDSELDWTHDHVHDHARRVPSTMEPEVEVIVDPDPATVLLERADQPGNVLCFASHDRMPLSAKVMHSVGSELIMRATHPFLVVGASAADEPGARDLVVALDGVHDPQVLLTTAISWARLLNAPLRIVTVYEPVPPDLRRPSHYSRGHGPATDPDEYLGKVAQSVDTDGVSTSTVSIADPVSAAAGLEQHLESRPATLLVVGGPHKRAHLGAGTVRELLRGAAVPLLVVSHDAEDGGQRHTAQ